MMATLLQIAGRLGAEQTERAVLEFMPDLDELFAVLPFVASPTDAYSWYRTGNIPEAPKPNLLTRKEPYRN